jgi:hypothetical protein
MGAPAPKLGVGKLSFGLLETLCPPELVDRVLQEAGREGERNRLLPPRLVVYALLLMCLSGTMGYGRLMREFATQAVKWQSPVGRSAFGKARMRLGSEVMEGLFGVLARPLGNQKLDADWCFWRERRVVAIDGTTFPLPVNQELETEFGGQIANDSSKRRVGVSQARMVSLIECGTRALLAVALGSYRQGEGSLARQLANALEPGMMVLADRCFPANRSGCSTRRPVPTCSGESKATSLGVTCASWGTAVTWSTSASASPSRSGLSNTSAKVIPRSTG